MENFETYKLDQTGQQTQAILDQVSTNTADIAQLRALYEALTQSEPVIIQPSDTWPVADPQENVIYRVIDRVNTPPQSYSDYMWNGTAMVLMATYNNSIDNEPTAGSNNLVKSGGVAASIVFDISAYHATGSTLATYSNLAAALDSNNGGGVPQSLQKGGMSVKFVLTSDNKYVQWRLMADEFTTDTTQWAIAEEGVYVENPEYVYVKTDSEGKILWAIKVDGSIYYGAGVPQQVKDYIEEKISSFSLDEYEDIVSFLSDYLGSDTTLKVMIDGINERTPELIDNPEFIAVETDAEDKVLSGRKTNGTKVENLPVEFKDKVSVGDDIYVKGNIRVNEKFDVNGNIIENIQDPEGRIEIKTDADGRILAFRDSEGKVVENVGVVADTGIFNHLMLTEDGMGEFEQALIDSGFNPGSSEIPFKNKDLVRIFDDNNLSVYRNYNARKLVAGFRDIVVWADRFSLSISTNGFDGEQTVIVLNSTNFPNLIDNSRVGRVILMPWTRNAVNGYDGANWRMVVITNLGQIYHNFPSREVDGDGTALEGDEFRFDESVVWELPERWSPVRTTTGNDAILIASGKYKYFPGLNDSAYTFHPAINQDNGYGNGGFPAYIDKDNELHQTTRYGRFTQYRRDDEQDNSFIFMAGCATHEKLTLLGTYRSNRAKQTRTCVFITNDGGRQWFCRYEFGIGGYRIDGDDNVIVDAVGSTTACDTNALANPVIITENFNSPNSGYFSIVGRYQYIPSEDYKEIELTKKFKWLTPVSIQNISIDDNNHVIIECNNHNLHNGEVIAIVKNTNASSDWDWLVNDSFNALSCGNGVIFSVRVIDNSTLELCNNYANPHNNLSVRHIHSINRCKDGYTIGTGEFYPEGWILYLPVFQSDSFARKYPWDTMEFVRLNSTRHSIQRPLGVELAQDSDNTVTVGIDNEFTPIDNAELPEGRIESIRRSSNGLWRGKLVDFDDQNKFSCIFQSDEVCYFYRNIWGIDIYIGQQGHIGVSSDGGSHWTEARTIDNEPVCAGGIPQGSFDVVNGGYIVIDNYIFKNKGINL